MDRTVQIFKILSTMTDDGAAERGESLGRDFDGAGNEELVVRGHFEANVQRSTLNVQRSTQKAW